MKVRINYPLYFIWLWQNTICLVTETTKNCRIYYPWISLQFLISPAFFPCHDPGMSGAKRGCRRKTPSPRDWQKINIKCLFLCTNSCRILSVSLDSLKKKIHRVEITPKEIFWMWTCIIEMLLPPLLVTLTSQWAKGQNIFRMVL